MRLTRRLRALDNVLILARDDVVAALLGLLVELKGFQPRFPGRNELAVDALTRDRFKAVLLDCDHPQCGEMLLAEIRKGAAQPILFSPVRLSDEVREVAVRHRARCFTLPTDPETFGRILQL